MGDQHLIEDRLSSTELFQGRLLHAYCDQVRLPDGTVASREYVVHPGAVLVVPLLEVGGELRVVLERQFRYPVEKVLIEFPAGKLDPDESLQSCAQRELLEETGYRAAQWAHAGLMHPVVSYSTEAIDIWFARGLTAGAARLDNGEFLEVITATPAELLQWCCDGRVTDGKTLVAALWLQNVLSGSWPLHWQPAEASRIVENEHHEST